MLLKNLKIINFYYLYYRKKKKIKYILFIDFLNIFIKKKIYMRKKIFSF
jgi:hypothetical protein